MRRIGSRGFLIGVAVADWLGLASTAEAQALTVPEKI